MSEIRTLIDLLAFRSASNDPAFIFYDAFRATRAMTARDVWNLARKFATALGQARSERDCVIIALENSPDFLGAYFGTMMCGKIPVPLQTADFQRGGEWGARLAAIQKVTGATTLIGNETSLRRAKALPFTRLLSALECGGYQAHEGPVFPVESDDPCMIQFSSGSTQEPKGVVLSHANILANLGQIERGMAANPADVGCSWLPFYHDMGWIGGVLSPLYTAYPVHLLSPIDFLAEPFGWLKLIEKVRATLMIGPDFAYRLCVRKITREEAASLDLSRIRLALSGGEPVSAQTLRAFAAHFKSAGFSESALFPVYGLAENSLAVTFPRLGRPFSSIDVDFNALSTGLIEPAREHRNSVELVSCGVPLYDIQLKIVDERFQELQEGRIGKILIRSPSMTSGYFANAELTRGLFEEGWLKTGDLGCRVNGELYVVDREKDVIVANGKNLFPADLERKVSEIQGYRFGRCAVVSVFDRGAQREEVHAVIESREIWPWRRSALAMKAAVRLSEICPVTVNQVHVVPPCTLPRTSSGKVKHFETKKKILSGEIGRSIRAFMPRLISSQLRLLWTAVSVMRARRKARPRHDLMLESYLRSHLAGITGISKRKISSTTLFSEMRIDSIGVVRLHARLREDLAPIPLHQLIDFRNLKELHEYLLEHHAQAVENWVQKNERNA